MKVKPLEFAKVTPAICHVPGLFASRSKGAPNHLMTVDHLMGEMLYRFVGPQLGPMELRVLYGLVALSALQNAPMVMPQDLDEVQALLSHGASVRTTYNQLAQAIGYQPDSGSSHAAIRRALQRLFTVSVFVSRADEPAGKNMAAGHLLTQLATKEAGKTIAVGLCAVLAAAVFGGPGEYLRVDLDEVRRLRSDAALLLHRRLHFLNPGKKARFMYLDTLAGYVWPEEATANAHCTRRRRIKAPVNELKTALGWSVTAADDGFTIGRPA